MRVTLARMTDLTVTPRTASGRPGTRVRPRATEEAMAMLESGEGAGYLMVRRRDPDKAAAKAAAKEEGARQREQETFRVSPVG